MADSVKGALKSFWTLVNNWKEGKNAQLRLSSENGHLSVNYSMDLGVWVPPTPRPPGDIASRGHPGPRKGAGPSRQRRRERRAAERAAEVEASEEVAVTETEESVEEADTPVLDVAETAPNIRTCTRCGKPTKGHPGPCGVRCSNVPASPELLRQTPGEGDTSLNLTPVREVRESEAVTGDSTSKHTVDEQSFKHQGFQCDYCDYRNNSKDILKEHMKKHKNARTRSPPRRPRTSSPPRWFGR